MTGTAAEERTSRCARCGYDLRGTVATWKDSCPLEGQCTECGFTFEWADVFDSSRNPPTWCIEFSERKSLLRKWFATFLRSFVPWRFWHELKPSHEVRTRRLALYFLLLFLVPLFPGYVVVQGGAALLWRYQMEGMMIASTLHAQTNLPVLLQLRDEWDDNQALDQVSQEWLDRQVYSGLRRPVLHSIESQSEWDDIWQQRVRLLEGQIDFFRQQVRNPPRIQHSYAMAAIEAIVFPLSDESWGEIHTTMGVQQYTSPIELHARLAASPRWGIVRGRYIEDLFPVMAGFVFGVAFLLFFPFTYILLPITRRRARVRAVHFLRITTYSLFVPVTIALMSCCVLALNPAFPRIIGRVTEPIQVMAAFAPIPMLMAWWFFAIRMHLRLPNALLQVIVLTILTILLIVAAVAWAGWVASRVGLIR